MRLALFLAVAPLFAGCATVQPTESSTPYRVWLRGLAPAHASSIVVDSAQVSITMPTWNGRPPGILREPVQSLVRIDRCAPLSPPVRTQRNASAASGALVGGLLGGLGIAAMKGESFVLPLLGTIAVPLAAFAGGGLARAGQAATDEGCPTVWRSGNGPAVFS